MNTHDLESTLIVVDTMLQFESLIQAEEQMPPVTSRVELKEHYAARALIENHLETVLRYVQGTRNRLGRLPKLARLEEARWAQAMLALPNLALLEVDTDGLNDDAAVLRVLVMDTDRGTFSDILVRPPTTPSAHVLSLTGIDTDALKQAKPFEEVWPLIVDILKGKHLLSYGLAFDLGHLARNAEKHNLEMPYLVAECLMLKSTSYLRSSSYRKLADLCQAIGSPLPQHPDQTAYDRARGQLHLLEAMAQGITHAHALPQTSSNSSEDEDTEQDEHPF